MNQRLKTCIEILKHCIKYKISGAEGCAKFNKPNDFINSCVNETRELISGNNPTPEQKAFFEVYNQFIDILL